MEDIKYASPTAEGEYRAKAAKMKLPLSGFKKNNSQKYNKNGNAPEEENMIETPQPQEIEISVSVENPSTVVQEETDILEQNKKKGGRRTKFNKGKVKEIIKNEEVLETSENILPKEAEIELDVEPKEIVEEPVTAEDTENKSEEQAPETSDDSKSEKPKRTRRPNRGQGKTKRTSRGSKKAK